MSLISKHKQTLINILRYLNTKPGFMRLFYWIHEIRCTPFKPTGFIAALIDSKFLIGVYDLTSSTTWQRMAKGEFERAESEVVTKMAPFFDTFVDIGGHIGYFTCLVGTHTPTTQILVIEPSPANFASLIKNIDINRLTNVEVLNIGLADTAGTATLYGSDAMSSFNAGSFGGTPKVQAATIEVRTLDSLAPKIKSGAQAFIKMDVESREFAVLQGAQKFIQHVRPIAMLIEISNIWSGGTNPNFAATFDLLAKLGYAAYFVDETLPLPLKKIGPVTELHGANYLFVRTDLVQSLSARSGVFEA